MNLAFSDDEQALRDVIRKRLAGRPTRIGLDASETAASGHDATLWAELAGDGWLGAAIDENHGGSGLGPVALCVLAEEIGRAAPAVPFSASVCGFAAAMTLCDNGIGDEWLPKLATGEAIGICIEVDAWAQAPTLDGDGDQLRLSGRTHPLTDGVAATVAVTLAGPVHAPRVLLLQLPHTRERPNALAQLDLLHPAACIRFDKTSAMELARGNAATELWQKLRDRRAIYGAFEQLGGAAAALEMARAYSLERYAFGRAIGSFQALKHSMADMLAALEMARANAHYAAAALSAPEPVLAEAAAVAHLSAKEAYTLCARQNLQIHGGIGVTWESDAHLHYRRAQTLATGLGPARAWPARLIELLEAKAGSTGASA